MPPLRVAKPYMGSAEIVVHWSTASSSESLWKNWVIKPFVKLRQSHIKLFK